MAARQVEVEVAGTPALPALLLGPENPSAIYVFAHGAGAGMTHAFMEGYASGLAARGVATLRFQFPFMAQGSRRVDSPAVAQAAVRAACALAAQRVPGVPLFAGGKSFGGRMTSQAQAVQPLDGVRGLVFTGFPLHPAGKPSTTRAQHLQDVRIPMLFLQGTRDALAEAGRMREVVAGLRGHASLHEVEGADHAFHVLVRSGRTDVQVRDEMLDAHVAWQRAVTGP